MGKGLSEGMYFQVEKVQNGQVFKAIYLDEDYQNVIPLELRKEAHDRGVFILYKNNHLCLASYDFEPIPVLPERLDLKFLQNCYAYKPKALKMSELKWKVLIRNLIKGKNIMMVGHSGTGKTVSARYAARVLKRPFFFFPLGSMQDPQSSLIGNTKYNKEKGTFFKESRFIKAIKTPNAVILLDEFSRAHNEAHNILMTVLDKEQAYISLDEGDDEENIIYVAPGVSFIATSNIGNEYTGTKQMDRATIDRFSFIEVDLLNKEEELDLLKGKFPKCDPTFLGYMCDISDVIRTEYLKDDAGISCMMSTRMLIEAAEFIDDGFTIGEALEATIIPLFDPKGGTVSERAFLLKLISTRVAKSLLKKSSTKFINRDIDPSNPFKLKDELNQQTDEEKD